MKKKEHNPYSLYTKLGMNEPDTDIRILVQKREEEIRSLCLRFDIKRRSTLIKEIIKKTTAPSERKTALESLRKIFGNKEKEEEIEYYTKQYKTR